MTNKNVDLDDLKATAERVWLAGLGALAEAEKHGDKIFQSLVERGKKFEELLPQAGDAVKDSVESAKKQANKAFREVESRFDRKVKRAMERAGVARQDEVEALRREVARLKRERTAGASTSKKKTAKK